MHRIAALPCALLALAAPALAQDTVETRTYDLRSTDSNLAESEQDTLCLGHEREYYGDAGGSFIFEDDVSDTFFSDLLVEMLEANLDSMQVEGAWIERRDGSLLVRHTAKAHALIGAWLDHAHARLDQQVSVEVRVVALDPDHAPAGLLTQAPGAPLSQEVMDSLDALIAAGEATLLGQTRVLAADGETATASALRSRNYVGDFEVNQTGVIPVLNPVIFGLSSGTTVSVVPHLFPKRDRVQLDCHVEVALPSDVRTVEQSDAGTITFPQLHHMQLGASVLTRAGETVLLGMARSERSLEDPDAGAPLFVAMCSAQPLPALPLNVAALGDPDEVPTLRVHRVAPLSGRRTDFDFRDPWTNPYGYQGGGGVLVTDFDDGSPDESWLADWVLRALHDDAWEGWEDPRQRVEVDADHLVVLVPEALQADVDAALEQLRDAHAQGVHYEVLVVRVPATALPRSALLTSESRRALLDAGRVTERCAVAGLDRQTVQVGVHREEGFVHDIERSSGGTGQVVEQCDDPVVETVAAGTRGRLRGVLGSSSQITVHCDFDLRSYSGISSSSTEWGLIETVRDLSALPLKQRVTLESGQTIVLATQSVDNECELVLLRATALPKR
ncbi:hypothetical protein OAX78_02595 [Planctomycetota bacterium]|nr:hypothetical protein [Planctomycetota bacterium]